MMLCNALQKYAIKTLCNKMNYTNVLTAIVWPQKMKLKNSFPGKIFRQQFPE